MHSIYDLSKMQTHRFRARQSAAAQTHGCEIMQVPLGSCKLLQYGLVTGLYAGKVPDEFVRV